MRWRSLSLSESFPSSPSGVLPSMSVQSEVSGIESPTQLCGPRENRCRSPIPSGSSWSELSPAWVVWNPKMAFCPGVRSDTTPSFDRGHRWDRRPSPRRRNCVGTLTAGGRAPNSQCRIASPSYAPALQPGRVIGTRRQILWLAGATQGVAEVAAQPSYCHRGR